MIKILIAMCFVFLTACGNQKRPDSDLTVSHQFITKKIPSELLEIPEPVPLPNLNGTQKDVSLWIIENEKRTLSIEAQIKKIKEYHKE